jgi:hypothetical protein
MPPPSIGRLRVLLSRAQLAIWTFVTPERYPEHFQCAFKLPQFFGQAQVGRRCFPYDSQFRILGSTSRDFTLKLFDFIGAPEEIRTPDPQIRSLVLYSGASICVIIPCSSAPTQSNNIIQKGLAFSRDRSGSVVYSGR